MPSESSVLVRLRMLGGTHFRRDVDRSGDKLGGLGRRARGSGAALASMSRGAGLARRALVGVASVAGVTSLGVAAAFKTGLDEAREQERVSAQTSATLRSTRGAANVTRREIEGYASSMQRATGIQDDLIQSGANVLLTFTNIRKGVGKGNDIFRQANELALDYSVSQGKDLKSSALAFGKALNAPGRGITRLTRLGVEFTDQQIAQVKALDKSGKRVAAQKILLAELRKEFGGSARAFGDTTAGKIEKVKRAWEDASQALGQRLLPYMARGATVLARFIAQMQTGQGAGGRVAAQLQRLASAGLRVYQSVARVARGVGRLARQFHEGDGRAVALVATIGGLAAGLFAMQKAVKVIAFIKALRNGTIALNLAMYANPIVLVVGALVALGVAAFIAYKKVAWFRRGVNSVFRAVKGFVLGAISFVRRRWPLLVSILGGPIGIAVYLVLKHWRTIRRVFLRAVSAVLGFVRARWRQLQAILINPVRNAARGVGRAFMVVVRGATAMVNRTRARIRSIVDWFRNLPARFLSSAAAIGRAIVQGIVDAIRGAREAVTNALKEIIPDPLEGAINSATGGALSALGPAGSVVDGARRLFGNEMGGPASGFRRVGERGPEIVHFGRRAHVTPASVTRRMERAGQRMAPAPGAPIVIHYTAQLDGREIHRAVYRVERELVERR